MWWFLRINRPNLYLQKPSLGRKKRRIGSLVSHIGILDDEFEEILAAGKQIKVCSWYNNLGVCVKTHRDHSITCIASDEAFAPLKWAHLPIHHIIWENTRPAWVCRPTCGWVEISSGEKIHLGARYQSSDILVKRLVDRSAAEEVLEKWRIMKKYIGLAYSGGR